MKNFTSPVLAALFLAAGLTVGCDQSATDAADAAKGLAGDAAQGAKDMGSDAADGAAKMAGDAADGMKKMAGDAAEGVKEMADEAVDSMKKMAGGDGDGDVDMKKMAGDAMETAKGAMADGVDVSSLMSESQVSTMLDKVKDMISSGDAEGAAGLMEKLKNVELPAAVQPQFDKLKATLDKAMEAGNALQSFGK